MSTGHAQGGSASPSSVAATFSGSPYHLGIAVREPTLAPAATRRATIGLVWGDGRRSAFGSGKGDVFDQPSSRPCLHAGCRVIHAERPAGPWVRTGRASIAQGVLLKFARFARVEAVPQPLVPLVMFPGDSSSIACVAAWSSPAVSSPRQISSSRCRTRDERLSRGRSSSLRSAPSRGPALWAATSGSSEVSGVRDRPVWRCQAILRHAKNRSIKLVRS